MKRYVKITVIVLAVIVFLAALYLIVPGFTKQGNAYISDYVVSEDGSEITIKVGVSTSIGYVRKVSVHQQHGGKLYLDCYSAFGGINGSWGAKSEYTIPLDAETETIAIYRSTNCYDTVLEKMDDGKWIPKDKLIYGTTNDPNSESGDNTIKVTENSVGGIGRESFKFPVEISEDDANALSEIINGGAWIEEPTECESDCVINLKGHWMHYNSESGILNKYNLKEMSIYSSKVQKVNGKSLVLSEKDRATVNTILEKYITLGFDSN